MIRMREEMRKVKNQRLKPSNRVYNTTDFEDMEVKRKRLYQQDGNKHHQI